MVGEDLASELLDETGDAGALVDVVRRAGDEAAAEPVPLTAKKPKADKAEKPKKAKADKADKAKKKKLKKAA